MVLPHMQCASVWSSLRSLPTVYQIFGQTVVDHSFPDYNLDGQSTRRRVLQDYKAPRVEEMVHASIEGMEVCKPH